MRDRTVGLFGMVAAEGSALAARESDQKIAAGAAMTEETGRQREDRIRDSSSGERAAAAAAATAATVGEPFKELEGRSATEKQ